MSNRRRCLTVFLIAALTIFGIALKRRSAAQAARYASRADELDRDAKASLPPGSTYKDVRHWLEKNGFTVIHSNWVCEEYGPGRDGQSTHYGNEVKGCRVLGRTQFVFSDDYWVTMFFEFKPEMVYDVRTRDYSGGELVRITSWGDSGPPTKAEQAGY